MGNVGQEKEITLGHVSATAAVRKVLVLGTHLLAEELIDLSFNIDGLKIVGFVENLDPGRCKIKIGGLPVYWLNDLIGADGLEGHYLVSGLSTTARRPFIERAAGLRCDFVSMIHPSAVISDSCVLGTGVIISAGVIVASNTKIGDHTFINRGAMVGHHTRIGNFVSIQPGANIAGVCEIGDETYIGMSATVIDHTRIGRRAFVGAQALVLKDVPEGVLVVGSPARIARRLDAEA